MTNWFLFFVNAYLITYIPIIGKYFRMLNTLFHEIGHAIFALITDGKVYSITLSPNTEGVALTGSRHWIGRVLTSFAGYPFASFMAYLSFYVLSKDKFTLLLIGFAVITVIACVCWVRNLYGFIWCVSFLVVLGVVLWFGTPLFHETFSKFLSFLLLNQSVATSVTIFYLSIKRSKKAGDATNLAKHTYIPAAFWGFLFLLQSILFAAFAFTQFIL